MFYVTTPIYYVNSDPHIGTAYTTVLADTLRRFHRMLGDDTYFLTGTDEHGEKIAKAAAAGGITPKEWVDRVSGNFMELWPKLHILPDRFIRTTDSDHVEIVKRVLQLVYDKGDIYFGEYGGFYCVGCERFLTEKDLIDGKCPDHGTVPEVIKEKNYFFRMGRHQQWLIEQIESNPKFITPERYRNEVLSFLKGEPLEDLCISRPKSRLSWGIEIPFDREFVTYVWFDALLNYLTATGWDKRENWSTMWGGVQHIIGKDILKPHGIYWPTMLRSAGIEPFQSLAVHGYWTFKGSKISKSAGSGPPPILPLTRAFGVDAMRYFLVRDMVFGLDANFSVDAIAQRLNSDLANDFGNLLSRISKLVADYFDGKIPPPPEHPGELATMAQDLVGKVAQWVVDLKLPVLVEETMQLVRATNRFFESSAPWALAKTDKRRCGEVLYESAEALRIAAIILSPIMPERTSKLLARLGEAVQNFSIPDSCAWGRLRAGAALSHGDPLFPRIDEKDLPGLLPEFYDEVAVKASHATPQREAAVSPLIEIQDFTRVELRVAKVVSSEAVPNTDKLLRLQIEIGGERRQIIAGIAQHYRPEQIVGRLIIVVANLKPAKLRGEVSQGMLLAAKKDSELRLITVDGEISSGATAG